ncbi:uncharacterized protein LOC113908640 [Zalophus californianus]|uniref:Uncharacterized protein LOC113908640 n=1 Tax=Zalophus californianus TaxID=9704 RepID=A0A6J2B3G8_ZALCA|nr:uncharacterized protein LOC113908640 [Zalophus californianus]
MCVCAALEHRPRGADWAGGARRGKPLANLLPFSPVDVGAGAVARRAEGQIVPAATPRAPPRLASPRPGLPGPGGPGRQGEGRPPRLLDPRSPLRGLMSGLSSLGKSPGRKLGGKEGSTEITPGAPTTWHVTFAPPSCHHSEIHLAADLREEREFGTFESFSHHHLVFLSELYLELRWRKPCQIWDRR